MAYLTLLSHDRNRQYQGYYLRSQTQLLSSLLEPNPPPATLSRADNSCVSSSTLIENAKLRWNEEIESAVRWVQHKDWDGVREGMEDTVSRVFGVGLQRTREGVDQVEKHAGPIVKAKTDQLSSSAHAGADKAYTSTNTGLQYVGSKAAEVASATKSRADVTLTDSKKGLENVSIKLNETASTGASIARQAAVDTREYVEHAVSSGEQGVAKIRNVTDKVRQEAASTGTGVVESARGAIRDVISKGIEKGKDVVGKAQDAVGNAVGKAESNIHNTSLTTSREEETLRQRYEKSSELSKTVDEALAERYTPIDQRNNTILRGV